MNAEDPAFFAIPQDPEETRCYLDVLGAATSPMARLLREIIDPSYTETNLIVRLKSSEYVHERPVVETPEKYLEGHFPDGPLRAQLAGRVYLDYHWVGLVCTSQVSSVFFTAISVLLLTGWTFRSVLAGLLCTAVVGMSVLVNLGSAAGRDGAESDAS